jgi:hypothetical protein
MKRPEDLDIFAVYTGSIFHGSRSEIVAKALTNARTRDLVWLYLAVNEIPWKRLTVRPQLSRLLRQQGERGSRIAATWRTATGYWLDRPFHVWYAGDLKSDDSTVSRSEGQQWREAIWLRRIQLASIPLG